MKLEIFFIALCDKICITLASPASRENIWQPMIIIRDGVERTDKVHIFTWKWLAMAAPQSKFSNLLFHTSTKKEKTRKLEPVYDKSFWLCIVIYWKKYKNNSLSIKYLNFLFSISICHKKRMTIYMLHMIK